MEFPSRHFFTGVFLQEMPRIMDKVKYSGGRGQTKSSGTILDARFLRGPKAEAHG
jgi:hypothetical protein